MNDVLDRYCVRKRAGALAGRHRVSDVRPSVRQNYFTTDPNENKEMVLPQSSLTMRSSLVIRTAAAVLRRRSGPCIPRACATLPVVLPIRAYTRPFSDDKKPEKPTVSVTFEEEEEPSEFVRETLEAIDRSEFTHEIPIRMPDMGESTGKGVEKV